MAPAAGVTAPRWAGSIGTGFAGLATLAQRPPWTALIAGVGHETGGRAEGSDRSVAGGRRFGPFAEEGLA